MPRSSSVAALALLVSLAVGCGGTHESSVYGTVYLDDQPLPMGNVTFYPTEGGAAVYSQIARDGSYRLTTGSEEGLKPGEYRVTVVATDNPPAEPGQTPPIGKRITPEKYSRLEQTDLEYTVTPGNNEIDIRLESQ